MSSTDLKSTFGVFRRIGFGYPLSDEFSIKRLLHFLYLDFMF
ncbi:hypothetical protein [Gabonibacter chumensis]|nr:hypothetical protein [Gabonibacter chumensis]MCR9011419.1 hypothetical protein [Gabonibacter chumensis]